MITYRIGTFETNSSSSHTFVYYRDLHIPKTVNIRTNVYDLTGVDLYYNVYGSDFLSWLKKIGVQEIFVDNRKITKFSEQQDPIKLINGSCETHNKDIDDDAIVKYILFGELLKEANNSSDVCDLEAEYMNNPNYVCSSWFY